MLFQMDVSGVTSEQAIHSFWAYLGQGREGEAFANDLVRGWATDREKIDGIIRDVSQHWRLERMARVDRNILRLATYELMALDEVAGKFSAAVAKRFGSEGSPGFVNGVLDRIASDLEKD